MAYLNFLASVPVLQVDEVRTGRRAYFSPSFTTGVSHLLAYWVTQQPLGQLLGEALDGGEVIQSDLTHRLRVPLVHFPSTVRRLCEDISTQLQLLNLGDDDWLNEECQRLIHVFRHAAEHGECILSILEMSHGPESDQANRLFWETNDGTKMYSQYKNSSSQTYLQRLFRLLKGWFSR